MMTELERRDTEYKINLANVERDGSFNCPKCGSRISPDEPEENYEIIDPRLNDNKLSELVIGCKKCGSTIILTECQAGLV